MHAAVNREVARLKKQLLVQVLLLSVNGGYTQDRSLEKPDEN